MCILPSIPSLDLSGSSASLRHQNGAYGRAEAYEKKNSPWRPSTWTATSDSSSRFPTHPLPLHSHHRVSLGFLVGKKGSSMQKVTGCKWERLQLMSELGNESKAHSFPSGLPTYGSQQASHEQKRICSLSSAPMIYAHTGAQEMCISCQPHERRCVLLQSTRTVSAGKRQSKRGKCIAKISSSWHMVMSRVHELVIPCL